MIGETGCLIMAWLSDFLAYYSRMLCSLVILRLKRVTYVTWSIHINISKHGGEWDLYVFIRGYNKKYMYWYTIYT